MSGRRLLTFFLALAVVACAPVSWAESADGSGTEEPLVRWRQEVMRGPDPGPAVEVSGDGEVRLHLPFYWRGGDDYALRPSAAELETLRRDLARLEGLDVEVLRAEKAQWQRQRASHSAVPERVGSAESVFELRGTRGEVTEVRWRAPAFDATWIDSPSLEALGRLEELFQGWLRDPRRLPLEEASP